MSGPASRTPPGRCSFTAAVIVAVVVAVLAGFVPLDYLAGMVSIGTLVAFIVVSLGVIPLRIREPDLPRGYILISLHWDTWLAFGAWVGVALIFYFTWGRHHSALNEAAAG